MPDVRLEDVPESDRLYELVRGQKVWMPLRSVRSFGIAQDLSWRVHEFATARGLGQSHPHMLYDLRLPARVYRRPSFGFVSVARWPATKPVPATEAWDVVPDLVAEVTGPDDGAEELLAKVRQYQAAGVRIVWVVYSGVGEVHAFTGPRGLRTFTTADTLDGGDVLPGFAVPVSELVPPAECEPDAVV